MSALTTPALAALLIRRGGSRRPLRALRRLGQVELAERLHRDATAYAVLRAEIARQLAVQAERRRRREVAFGPHSLGWSVRKWRARRARRATEAMEAAKRAAEAATLERLRPLIECAQQWIAAPSRWRRSRARLEQVISWHYSLLDGSEIRAALAARQRDVVAHALVRSGAWECSSRSGSGTIYLLSRDRDGAHLLRISDHELGCADHGTRPQHHRGPEWVAEGVVLAPGDLIAAAQADIADQIGEGEGDD